MVANDPSCMGPDNTFAESRTDQDVCHRDETAAKAIVYCAIGMYLISTIMV